MKEGNKEQRECRIGKLFNFRPLFFTAVFLCFGIYFYYQYHFNGVSAVWLLLLLPIGLTPFCFCRTRIQARKTALAVLLLGVSFMVGFFGFFIQLTNYMSVQERTEKCYVRGHVAETREYASSFGVVLDGVIIGEEWVNGKLIAYLDTSYAENISLSDEVLLTGRVQPFAWEEGEFVFSAKSVGKDIRYEMYGDSACVTGRPFHLFLRLRAHAQETISVGMDETPAAVTRAVLFGDTYGIEEALYENIRMGGIAHIFAVSGLHVGALYGACLWLSKKTALKKMPVGTTFLLVAAVLVIYAGICGFSASVVRATVICLSSYLLSLLWSKSDFLQALGLAAIVVLLFTPSALFEVGFQLSFVACLGLAFLRKPIRQVCDYGYFLWEKVFPIRRTEAQLLLLAEGDTLPPTIRERVYRTTASLFATTMSAQIATAPLLLYYFGYLSGWALLLNCVFVPIVTAFFSVLLAFVAIACLLPSVCSLVVLYLPNLVWSGLLLLFEAVDFSSFALTGVSVSGGAIVLYCTGWLFLTDKWNIDKRLKYLLSAVGFLSFGVAMVALNL